MAPTNGGEGIPAWVGAAFQAQPEYKGAKYVVGPSTPMQPALPRCLRCLVKVSTVEGEADPWGPFSVAGAAALRYIATARPQTAGTRLLRRA